MKGNMELTDGWSRMDDVFHGSMNGIDALVERHAKRDESNDIRDMRYRVVFSKGMLVAEEWVDAEGDRISTFRENGYEQWEDDANEDFDMVLNAYECEPDDDGTLAGQASRALSQALAEYFHCEHCGNWIKRESYNDASDNIVKVYDGKHAPENWCEDCADKDAVRCEECKKHVVRDYIAKRFGDACFCYDCDEAYDLHDRYNLEFLCGKIAIDENVVADESFGEAEARLLAERLRDMGYSVAYEKGASNDVSKIDSGDFRLCVEDATLQETK